MPRRHYLNKRLQRWAFGMEIDSPQIPLCTFRCIMCDWLLSLPWTILHVSGLGRTNTSPPPRVCKFSTIGLKCSAHQVAVWDSALLIAWIEITQLLYKSVMGYSIRGLLREPGWYGESPSMCIFFTNRGTQYSTWDHTIYIGPFQAYGRPSCLARHLNGYIFIFSMPFLTARAAQPPKSLAVSRNLHCWW